MSDSLARQLAQAGRFAEAAEQLYLAIGVLKLWYPPDSPEVAVEYAKVQNIRIHVDLSP